MRKRKYQSRKCLVQDIRANDRMRSGPWITHTFNLQIIAYATLLPDLVSKQVYSCSVFQSTLESLLSLHFVAQSLVKEMFLPLVISLCFSQKSNAQT